MLDVTERSLPNWLCTLTAAVHLTCSSVNLIMLVMIGFTRWFLITKPLYKFKKLYRPRNITIMMTFSWVYSAVCVVIPHFVGLGALGFSVQFKICQWEASMDPFKDGYSLLCGVGVFFMFVIVVINYTLIYRFVIRHGRKMEAVRKRHIRTAQQPNDASEERASTSSPKAEDQATQITQHSQSEGSVSASVTRNQEYRGKKKEDRVIKNQTVVVTKRLAVIILAFFFCSMPFGISILVTPLRPVVPWTFPIFFLSNCINPLIYAGTMPAFREVMGCIIRCRYGNIPASLNILRCKEK
ncbi:5-hydroxytryptamine receptor 1F-like [Strongylocentrotus purpuratus]|uniref:G-protein coupled receptors family 1 profile domain-containing protein n=1 Tax=Strongylocentrotus purpuratus TaxID=7668 RepID=A0A7M7N5A6_STRPU|nr:5-hydroxytryptamine receptor 1F-like [Strongylocentrotus purpuratus]